MPKQQITIEVDIPDGYEATGEFRSPTLDEFYLQRNEVKVGRFEHYASDFVILRKKWQWPEWLRLPYIAMQPNGGWYGFSDEPTLQDGFRWECYEFVYLLSPEYFDFTPPECTDWRQSLHKNPNAS